ncbi:MAG: hypothetical protein RL226_1899 [Bacteroidota bacterium]
MKQLPEPFITTLRNEYPTLAEAIVDGINTPPEVAINRNRSKGLEAGSDPVAWNPFGDHLAQRPVFALDPLWHIGAYYVMESASQFIAYVGLQLTKGAELRSAIDLCAAPGGKSTALLNVLPDDCVLVSNEVNKQRATVLAENSMKWGRANHIVTCAEVGQFAFLNNTFDLVVVDAPCSGEGMFRKDDTAIQEWSPQNVALCCDRQLRILDDATELVNEGGFLVYSTCTFNSAENDDQIRRLLSTSDWEVVDIETKKEWGIVKTAYGHQFFPGVTRGEGLYMAVLRKVNGQKAGVLKKNSAKTIKNPEFEGQTIQLADQVVFSEDGDRIRAFSTEAFELTHQLKAEKIYLLKAGIEAFIRKGVQLVPSAQLALYADFEWNHCYAMNHEEALSFLRCQAGHKTLGKGWMLMTYNCLGVGWAKAMERRWNNGWPQPWMLRLS